MPLEARKQNTNEKPSVLGASGLQKTRENHSPQNLVGTSRALYLLHPKAGKVAMGRELDSERILHEMCRFEAQLLSSLAFVLLGS